MFNNRVCYRESSEKWQIWVHWSHFSRLLVTVDFDDGSFKKYGQFIIQGVFFNSPPPKTAKYKKKLEYPDCPPPKSSKCQPVSNCIQTAPPLKVLSVSW